MTWQANPYSVHLALVAAISVAAAVYIWVHQWCRERIPGARSAALLLLACAEWILTYALELASADLPSMVFWNKVQYLGAVSVPVAWLAFTVMYTGRERWLTVRSMAALCVVPVLTLLLVFTNDSHGLIWEDISLDVEGSFVVLVNQHGPAYWLLVAFTYLIAVAVAVLLAPMLLRSPRFYRWQGSALLIATFVPVLGNVLYLAGLNPLVDLNLSPLSVTISSLIVAWTVARLRMGDIVSVSRGAVFEGMSDGVMVLDAQSRVVDLNPVARQLLGDLPFKPIGRPIDDLWPGWPQPNEETADRLDGGLELSLRKGSEVSSFDVRVSPLLDWRERLVSQVVVLRDVTERKRLERELLRAQRLEAAGRIAGQVAHDFNNLLTPMAAYPDLIKIQLPEGHPASPYCELMQEAAEQMAAINEDMMALGRRGHFDQQPVDLSGLVRGLAEQMPKVPESLQIELELPAGLPLVNASPAQLLRVFSNLLSNAREAMKDRGTLRLKTESLYLDEPFGRYNRVQVGEYVRVQVSDTGCGIPAGIEDKIFDAFFTTKTKGKRWGCGLGLSVVLAIVDDHHGYLDLESEVGKGTTFSVYLPVTHEIRWEKEEKELQGGNEAILLVDDDQIQRQVAKDLLRRLGYGVEIAASGEEGLRLLEERPADLVILDMIMPGGMDGAETYRRMLKVRPGQRAILVSGFAQSDRVLEAQRLGAGGYLRKPVTLEKLARAVRGELDREASR